MKTSERTRNLLQKNYQQYPKLQIQDIFKFIYQSSFGCEHMISSLQKATDDIYLEHEKLQNKSITSIETLDGDYCRIPLSILDGNLSAETFAKMFYISAKKEENGKQALQEKLEVAKNLLLENRLPFSVKDFEQAVKEWQKNGFAPLHHSDIYRKTYNPSYRVIAKKFIPFLPIIAEIDKRKMRGIIAIDGGSASGKSTLAEMLSKLYDCTIFHMDDFFLQPHQRTKERFEQIGGNIDWERFENQVLQPLSENKTIKYQKFDCSTMQLEEPIEIEPKELVIIEGAYSMRQELEKYYDFSVFLDITPNAQKERIKKRNSPQMAQRFFEEWIPLEEIYFSKMKIKEKCNICVKIDE